MFVYFIQQGIDGPIKIGKADRPDRRLSSLQGANPEGLRIRGICSGGHAVERHIQRYFAAERMNNREWFLPSERLEQFMSKLPDWDAVQDGAKCPEVIATREHIVCSLYKAGYSFRDIGELFGFSHQRSKQIVDNYEGPQRPKGRRHRTKPEEPIQVAYDRLAALHASDDLLLG